MFLKRFVIAPKLFAGVKMEKAQSSEQRQREEVTGEESDRAIQK
jgi:hypothetical protein